MPYNLGHCWKYTKASINHHKGLSIMSKSTYNGWTNYATWRINLEIFDGMTARELTGRSVPCMSELRDACQEYAEELIEATSNEGLARDYALAFLSDVDWWAIADQLVIADTDDEDEEESEEEEQV
jgi:hypothetical protein